MDEVNIDYDEVDRTTVPEYILGAAVLGGFFVYDGLNKAYQRIKALRKLPEKGIEKLVSPIRGIGGLEEDDI